MRLTIILITKITTIQKKFINYAVFNSLAVCFFPKQNDKEKYLISLLLVSHVSKCDLWFEDGGFPHLLVKSNFKMHACADH